MSAEERSSKRWLLGNPGRSLGRGSSNCSAGVGDPHRLKNASRASVLPRRSVCSPAAASPPLVGGHWAGGLPAHRCSATLVLPPRFGRIEAERPAFLSLFLHEPHQQVFRWPVSFSLVPACLVRGALLPVFLRDDLGLGVLAGGAGLSWASGDRLTDIVQPPPPNPRTGLWQAAARKRRAPAAVQFWKPPCFTPSPKKGPPPLFLGGENRRAGASAGPTHPAVVIVVGHWAVFAAVLRHEFPRFHKLHAFWPTADLPNREPQRVGFHTWPNAAGRPAGELLLSGPVFMRRG